MSDIAKLTIFDTTGDIEPKQFSEFLSLLEACVVAASDLNVGWDISQPFPSEIEEQFRRISPLKWNEYFDRRAPELISIHSLTRNSPLELALACSLILVSVAVVFSGGKIKASTKGFEATLPSLGDGIASLKKALGLGGKVTSSYSIRTITIKLDAEEVKALQLQDPSQRNKGGFQNFLIGLQSRLNRTTKELTLTDVDLERVMRYKADPKKGGFQNRFKKIFGRHFPSA